ncbi:efflux RND transporter permease subunit [Tepidibacter formicigenes]|jgi:HAE1 family hydrophobic/amphiphilic exporter-1|uniref:Hydrophobic/amphiphilic exporter-1, HAE1 family n=1 Tax=Tepidibacter formicigenes DSM 15518 TaxID=1123349 RepID=A0A1M6S0U2_9FIRM|nr:efflux RND transporter permease subunit [Tepidibacter formicigenes]SHK38295.1 hydrophobic/amphiphilic exporter-1, HAE1 family [Tepidibacter formicigenes DSM 15518]
MNISKISVKRPVTTLMFMFIAILIGMVSLTLLPIDLYPEMEIPVAIVSVNYSGVAPEEIETLITKPIEKSVATVSNLKNITSYSREGNSIVVVEFEYGTDMDFASLEMREKVDLVKGMLPDDASTPMVLKIDPNAEPIINLGISANMDLGKLQSIVEDELESRFERIEGVASVDLSGGDEKEVKIKINQEKLEGYGLSLGQIQNILRAENLNLPGGNVNKGQKELLVRTVGEFKSINEINEIPLTLNNGDIIRLSDIASISLSYKDKDSISRVNGKNSIGISITKQSAANTVKVAQNILEEVEKIRKDYPNIEVVVGFDQSEFINKSISNVTSSAITGGILAVVILFLFLRNIRSTFIVGTAIPVSIIATFALMYFGGLTINLISLGGLALGIGMLVDNSIVVLENIYRHRESGLSRVDAATKGAKEVTMAVFASTMTTIAVFLPIVFVKGFTAIVFKQLSFAVVFSLLASLIVAITVVPMMCSKILKVGEVKKRKHKGISLGRVLDLFSNFIDSLSNIYGKILDFVLKHRKTTVLIAVGIFVSSIALVGAVGGEFFPKEDEGNFTITIETPFGTTLEDSDKIVKEVEKIVDTIPEKDKVFSKIGESSGFSRSISNKSEVNVVLVDQKDRKRSTEDVVNEVREKVEDIAGAKITVAEASSMKGGGPSRAAIEIEIKGDDLETLKTIGDDFVNIVKSVPGTAEVTSDTEEGDPEARVVLNRRIASFYGITASDVANTIKSSIDGSKATTFKIDGDEIDVTVSLDDTVKNSIEDMRQILIKSPTGKSVPLGQISDVKYGNSPTQITRINQTRTVTVGSQLYGRDLKSVTNDIKKKLEGYNLPSGYSYNFTGQQEDMVEAFSSLGLALLLSIIIVYMVLASQFESLIHPFTVMLSVPFALSGGFIGLFVTGRSLSVPALIGVIMLSGIVVNNAIVLVDYINQLRDGGMDRKEAIIKAGFTRFRPILMTTLTTVLGLMPLALGIGEGASTQAPMATVVIGGLTLSTLLTLAFIPVVYTIFDDLIIKFKNKFRKKKEGRLNEESSH